MPDERDHRQDQAAGHHRGPLARDLERLVRELDESQESETPRVVQEPAAPQTADPEPENDERDLVSEIARLREDVHYLTELILSVRSEMLNTLMRTEQQLQQEIGLMEQRFRGDLSSIRDQLAVIDSHIHHSRPGPNQQRDE